MAKVRLVLDTNVCVSGLLWTGTPHLLIRAGGRPPVDCEKVQGDPDGNAETVLGQMGEQVEVRSTGSAEAFQPVSSKTPIFLNFS